MAVCINKVLMILDDPRGEVLLSKTLLTEFKTFDAPLIQSQERCTLFGSVLNTAAISLWFNPSK